MTPIIEKLTDLVNYDSEIELDEDLNVFIDVDTSTLLIIQTLDLCIDPICLIWIILQLPWIPHHYYYTKTGYINEYISARRAKKSHEQ